LSRNLQASLQDYRQQRKKSKTLSVALLPGPGGKKSLPAIDNLTERSYFFPLCKAIDGGLNRINPSPGLNGQIIIDQNITANKGQKEYLLILCCQIFPQGGDQDWIG
jgi:hypothetical protein